MGEARMRLDDKGERGGGWLDSDSGGGRWWQAGSCVGWWMVQRQRSQAAWALAAVVVLLVVVVLVRVFFLPVRVAGGRNQSNDDFVEASGFEEKQPMRSRLIPAPATHGSGRYYRALCCAVRCGPLEPIPSPSRIPGRLPEREMHCNSTTIVAFNRICRVVVLRYVARAGFLSSCKLGLSAPTKQSIIS